MAKGRTPSRRWYRPFTGNLGKSESRNPDRDRIPGQAQSKAELTARVRSRQDARRNRPPRVRVKVKG